MIPTMQHSNIDLKFVKKKAFPKETDFVKSIRPIYYFSRVFGFLPFSIEFDSKGEVQNARISAFDFLWFVIVIGFHLVLAFICLQKQDSPKFNLNLSYILFLGDYILIILGLIYGAEARLMDMCNRSKFVRIVRQFDDFDKEVSYESG